MGFWDAVASAGPYANNLHHTNTSSLNFYRPEIDSLFTKYDSKNVTHHSVATMAGCQWRYQPIIAGRTDALCDAQPTVSTHKSTN